MGCLTGCWMGYLTGWWWIPAVLVRLVAAGLLLFGPWTDEPTELDGWDVARFQEIAEAPGTPWADHPVEYPPGSVAVIEVLATDDVVATARVLVVAGLAADLATAGLLAITAGTATARAYLVLGTPLVPMGMLRLDAIVILVAVSGAVMLGLAPDDARPGWRRDGAFGALVALGAAIKVWPVLLIAAAVALRRWRGAVVATGIGVAALGLWLVWAGVATAPIEQVVSLRGAAGWHVESTIGAVVAVVTEEPSRFELDAYRIGVLDELLVSFGRLLSVAAMAALVVLGLGATRRGRGNGPEVVGLVMLASVAALLVTAPLLSPQFLLWLTPWAAPLAGRGIDRRPVRFVVGATMASTLLTGATLAVFGPPNLDGTIPALLLTARNLLLVTIVIGGAIGLRSVPGSRNES